MPWDATSAVSRPRIAAAAMRPWHSPICVSGASPVQSPIAYSQPSGTPGTRSCLSTGTGRPGSRPTRSTPMPTVAGRGPTATGISSPVNSRPSAAVTTTGSPRPARRAAVMRAPVTTVMHSASNAARSSSPANGSSRAISRSAPSSTTTFSLPRRLNACAISTPAAPPPSTSSRRGTSLALVTARLSNGPASRRPGTGGITGMLPVASTIAWAARSRRVVPSTHSTSIVRSPASQPLPRTSSIPLDFSQPCCPSSRQCEVM